MRTYADLHLCPPLEDLTNARSMASLLAELQVKTVGLVVPPERLSPLPTIAELFKGSGFDVAKRLNLKPKSREDLLRSLRRFRGKYEIIAVECGMLSVSRVAVRDGRVDIVYFPKQERGNSFRGNLASTCRAALEINLSELTSGPGFGARLRSLKREIQIAAKASTKVIGSSKASSPYELRSPRDFAAMLHLMGLPLDSALRAVSETPLDIVRKNRLRLQESELQEGVRIVRRPTRSG